MITGFSRKKIKAEETLGEKLKSARLDKKVTLEEAEIATKVRAKYLLALENGDWPVLPPEAYVRSFVSAYAAYLELPKSEIFPLFEREVKVKRGKSALDLSYKRTVKDMKIILTPKLLGYTVISLAVVAMFGYIIFQLVSFAGNPMLKVDTPNDNLVSDNDTVAVRGITDANTVLSVNNENIPVADDGHFSTDLKLRQGVNIIHVEAVGKAKKASNEVLTVEYKPKEALIDSGRNQ